MNWKLLCVSAPLTCGLLLSARSGLATIGEQLGTSSGHPELMLDSGLWRGTFLARTNETSVAGEAPDARDDFPEQRDSSIVVTASETGPTAINSKASSVDPGLVDLSTFDVTELWLATTGDLVGLLHEPGSIKREATLSDWEQATAESSRRTGNSFTKDGPSVISVVVGVVGLIVVAGMYLSSGRRG